MHRLLRGTLNTLVVSMALTVVYMSTEVLRDNVTMVSPEGDLLREDMEDAPGQMISLATSAPPAVVATVRAKPQQGPSGLCECRSRSLYFSRFYKRSFDSMMPGYNISTRQVLERQHPNFPFSLIDSIMSGTRCHLMPAPHRVRWQNTYWQEVRVSRGVTFLLFSAFLDNRPRTGLQPCVRIIVLTLSDRPPKPWSHIWFNATGPPAVSRCGRIEYLDWQGRDTSRQKTFLLTCRIPSSVAHLSPKAVSIVSRPCQQTSNLLEVVGAMERNTTTAYVDGRPPQGDNSTVVWATAVCGPALYYYNEDFSVRLVEWLELLRAQGFSQVFLLETDVHPNIQKVLRHYEAEGFVGVTKFSYPYPYINEPSLRRLWKLADRQRMWAMENAYFTECLLRHMHLYRFIAHIDPDEIPMMAKHTSFPALLSEQVRRARHQPAYSLRWFFHYDDLPTNGSLPEYVWALRHTRRTRRAPPPMPGFSKSVYDMDVATGVFSHQVLVCQRGGCSGRHTAIPPKLAYLGHYSKKCGRDCRKPDSTRVDLALHKYKDQVLPAVTKVLASLELI